MIRKKSKLSIIFSFFLISSIALGEIAHDHSEEILDSDHHESESHHDCLSCINDQVSEEEDFVSSFNKDNTYLASWFIKIESSNGIVSLFIFL